MSPPARAADEAVRRPTRNERAAATNDAPYRDSIEDTAAISPAGPPALPVRQDAAPRPPAMDRANDRNPSWWLSRRERRQLALVLAVTSAFVAAFALLGLAALGAL
jgi:hypothetical protein